MHIPDGFLDTKTVITTTLISAIGVGYALRKIKKQMPSRQIPLMGLVAAFVFSAQMLNFPIVGGTSGHLIGSVLASVLLGPSAAILVMTSVLLVQCFLFADGGMLALGANILNMAIIGSVGGYTIYYFTYKVFGGERGQLLAVGFAAWCSTVLASICCAGELAWSGTVSWSAGFPAMTNIHILIGFGEGLITILIITAIRKTRPELLENTSLSSSRQMHEFIIYGFIVVLTLGIFVSPFASSWPDGLSRVAAKLGFAQKAVTTPGFRPPISGYHLKGLSAELGTAIAGGIGTVVAFCLAFLLSRILVPKKSKSPIPEVDNKDHY